MGAQVAQEAVESHPIFRPHRDDHHSHSLPGFDISDNRATPHAASRDIDQ
jgi:hypothetical protein